jgi:hypothetical protein
MSKGQLIDSIRNLNTTAQATFLEQFDEQVLQQYAERLQAAAERRRRIGGWVRKKKVNLKAAS